MLLVGKSIIHNHSLRHFHVSVQRQHGQTWLHFLEDMEQVADLLAAGHKGKYLLVPVGLDERPQHVDLLLSLTQDVPKK